MVSWNLVFRPLSEPKKLKEKFDDIFAATRYNKAADRIKDVMKEKADELKLLENDKVHRMEWTKKANEIKQSINALEEEIEYGKIVVSSEYLT